jgi:hypothetical protein
MQLDLQNTEAGKKRQYESEQTEALVRTSGDGFATCSIPPIAYCARTHGFSSVGPACSIILTGHVNYIVQADLTV